MGTGKFIVLFVNDFNFSVRACLQCSVNFLLYSKVIQSHIYLYILFLTSSSFMLHHRGLDIVSGATQQDLIAYSLQRQEFATMNPRLPVYPTPFPSPWATTCLFFKSMSFFSVERFICAIYLIPDISDIMWYLSSLSDLPYLV